MKLTIGQISYARRSLTRGALSPSPRGDPYIELPAWCRQACQLKLAILTPRHRSLRLENVVLRTDLSWHSLPRFCGALTCSCTTGFHCSRIHLCCTLELTLTTITVARAYTECGGIFSLRNLAKLERGRVKFHVWRENVPLGAWFLSLVLRCNLW